MRRPFHALLSLSLLSFTVGCLGSTGGELIEFDAFAAGPVGARADDPYVFVNGLGYEVSLEKARLHIGATYLNRSRRSSVSADSGCVAPGIYVAEVAGGVDVDILDPTPQPFSVKGFADSERAATGEVWLMGGDVTDEGDSTVILEVSGTAVREGVATPFEGSLTIGANRAVEPSNAALPGSKPICKERIVTPIEVDLTPSDGGRLILRVDPAQMFVNVDFARLSDGQFRDDGGDQPSVNLYAGLRATAAYSFSWE